MYHHWCLLGKNFLDLLDVNHEEGFCCAICGKDNSLDTVFCDATALSFRQELSTSLKSSYSSLSPPTKPQETGR